MAEDQNTPAPTGKARAAVHRIGGYTRYMVIVPVLGLLTGALTLVVVGAIRTVQTIVSVFASGLSLETQKAVLVAFIELADMFLLAIVLYIIALGVYELFIDPELQLPHWLKFRDLSDLKYQLVSVVVVVLAVLFLGKAIDLKDGMQMLLSGAGIGSIIIALSAFLYVSHAGGGPKDHEPK